MKKKQYNQLITNDEKLILIDFFADWCGPCKQMEPTIKKVSKLFPKELTVYKVNIEKNPALAEELGIRSIPFFYLYRNGKVIWKHAGAMTFQEMKSTLSVFVNAKHSKSH